MLITPCGNFSLPVFANCDDGTCFAKAASCLHRRSQVAAAREWKKGKKKKRLAELQIKNYTPIVGVRVFSKLQTWNFASGFELSRFLIREWVWVLIWSRLWLWLQCNRESQMGPSGHRGFCRVCNYIVNYSVGPNQNIKAFIFKTSLQGSLWQCRATLLKKRKIKQTHARLTTYLEVVSCFCEEWRDFCISYFSPAASVKCCQ